MDFEKRLPQPLAEQLIVAAARAREATSIALHATVKDVEPGCSYSEGLVIRQRLRGEQAVETAYQGRALSKAVKAMAGDIAAEYVETYLKLCELHFAIDALLGKSDARYKPTPTPEPPEWPCIEMEQLRDKFTRPRLKSDVERQLEGFLGTYQLAHDYDLPVVEQRDGTFRPLSERPT